MNRWAEGTIAVAGTALGYAVGPVLGYSDGLGIGLGSFAIGAWFPMLALAIGAVAGTLRAAHLATRRSELVSRLALGGTRGGLVASESRRGAFVGLVWGGEGALVGALAAQVVAGFAYPDLSGDALTALAATVVSLVAAGTGAWTVAAAWATRGAVRGASPERDGRRRRRPPVWWIAAAALATVALLIVFGAVPWIDPSSTSPAMIPLQILTLLGLYVALPVALVTSAARLGLVVVRGAARVLGAGATPGSARSLAMDGLRRPTPLRGAALAAVGTVIAIATAVAITLNADAARGDLAQAIEPDAVVGARTGTDWMQVREGALTEGWVETPVEPDLRAALEADPRLVVIPAAVMVAPVWGGAPGPILAVDEHAYDDLLAHGLRPLAFTGPTGLNLPEELSVDGTTYALANPAGGGFLEAVPRAWAEEQWGAAPDAALLVYEVEPGASSLTGGADRLDAILAPLLPDNQPTSSYSSEDFPQTRAGAADLALIGGPFLALAVALVLAVVATSQRLRSRDQATMLALGARPRVLVGAASLEAAALTGVGALGGLAWGAALGALFLNATTPGIAVRDPWTLGWVLAQAPWVTLVAMAVVATALAAGLAALLQAARGAGSPAEQLRSADKEGVR